MTGEKKISVRIGDLVEPRPEWRDRDVPSGRIRALVPWGRGHVIYVEDDDRAFGDWVFQRVCRAHALGQAKKIPRAGKRRRT